MTIYLVKDGIRNRWLLMSVVALTLGTFGITTEVAHAAEPVDVADLTNQNLDSQIQDKEPGVQDAVPAVETQLEKTASSDKENESRGTSDSEVRDVSAPGKFQSNPTSNNQKEAKPVSQGTKLKDSVVPDVPKPSEGAATASQAATPQNVQGEEVPTPTPQTVDELIPDKDLQTIILFNLQKTHSEITNTSQITVDLLKELKSIDVSSKKQNTSKDFYDAVRNVKSLAGLQYATNLTELTITPDPKASKKWGYSTLRGQLKDVSALRELTNLVTAKLRRNQISDNDTGAFAGLTALKILDLSYNNITDLSFMKNLINLTNINFTQAADSQYKITSLKPLAKLVKLSQFSFGNNNISDLSPLRNITATPSFLDVGHNHIFDITPLLGLNWKPFIEKEPINYQISAPGQTWTLKQVTLNPNTTSLSTWSFAYDNLHDFNEFMQRDPQSTGVSEIWGAANWSIWHDLKGSAGSLNLVWDISRHNDLTRPTEPNGVQFDGKITVPYTLQAGIGAVTVAFQLDGGVKIAPFVILSGQSETSLDVLNDTSVQQVIAELEDRGFTYEKPVKYNQELTKTTEDSKVTYNDDAQSIKLLFNPLQKIYLVDEDGTAIGKKLIKKSGKTKTPWSVDLPVIDGYVYDRVDGGTVTDQKLSGTIQDVNNDIYVYYKSTGKPVTPPVTPPVKPVDPGTPVSNGTVTVHYQTQTGEKLAADDVLTGALGRAYATQAKDFKNYQLVTMSGNAVGVYTATSQNVYYTYQATTSKVDVGVKPATVAPNKPSVGNGKGTQDARIRSRKTGQKAPQQVFKGGIQAVRVTTVNKSNSVKPVSMPQLPQTSEHQTSAWWGAALLVMMGTLLGFTQIKNRGKR